MDKIYQPEVLAKTKEIIEILSDINFFKDHEIDKTDFAEQYFNNKLTEKFISGEINEDGLFSEDEMESFLKEIIAGSILHQLKEKGYVNSYEDDNTDEVFFLTEEGREYIKNISNDESV
jgi:hypothetical protein